MTPSALFSLSVGRTRGHDPRPPPRDVTREAVDSPLGVWGCRRLRLSPWGRVYAYVLACPIPLRPSGRLRLHRVFSPSLFSSWFCSLPGLIQIPGKAPRAPPLPVCVCKVLALG